MAAVVHSPPKCFPIHAPDAHSPLSETILWADDTHSPLKCFPMGAADARALLLECPIGAAGTRALLSECPMGAADAQTPSKWFPTGCLFAQTPPSDFFRGDDVARWPRSEHPAVGLSRSGAAIGARGSRPILCGAPVGPFDVSAGSTAVRGKKCCEGRRRLPAPRAASDIYPFTLVLSQKRLCP